MEFYIHDDSGYLVSFNCSRHCEYSHEIYYQACVDLGCLPLSKEGMKQLFIYIIGTFGLLNVILTFLLIVLYVLGMLGIMWALACA